MLTKKPKYGDYKDKKLYKQDYDKCYRAQEGMKEHRNAINYTSRIKRWKADPLKNKAHTLISGLRWGKGGTARMMELISQFIDKPCKYCSVILTLKNLSLDHKIPYMTSKRKSKLRNTSGYITKNIRDYSPEEEESLRSIENLHIVCLTCNRMKGNLNDEQFTKLLEFLEKDLNMKKIVCAKLKMSNFIFGR